MNPYHVVTKLWYQITRRHNLTTLEERDRNSFLIFHNFQYIYPSHKPRKRRLCVRLNPWCANTRLYGVHPTPHEMIYWIKAIDQRAVMFLWNVVHTDKRTSYHNCRNSEHYLHPCNRNYIPDYTASLLLTTVISVPLPPTTHLHVMTQNKTIWTYICWPSDRNSIDVRA
jgi:hypothetical protein